MHWKRISCFDVYLVPHSFLPSGLLEHVQEEGLDVKDFFYPVSLITRSIHPLTVFGVVASNRYTPTK